jgi:hypothetical protein
MTLRVAISPGRNWALCFVIALCPVITAPLQAQMQMGLSECDGLMPAGATVDADTSGIARSRTESATIDTVYTLDVDRQTRVWEDFKGGIGIAISGTQPANWHVCSGASVAVQRAELVLEGVSGLVHLRASLAPLLEILREVDIDARIIRVGTQP